MHLLLTYFHMYLDNCIFAGHMNKYMYLYPKGAFRHVFAQTNNKDVRQINSKEAQQAEVPT